MKEENEPSVLPEPKEQTGLLITKEKVTEFDVFKFGKAVFFVAVGFLVIGLALLWVMPDGKYKESAWDFIKVFVSSLTSGVIGLYFGKKAS